MYRRLTEFILRSLLELLVRHEFFYLASHRLNVVDNQIVQIGIRVRVVHNELATDGLTGEVGVGLDDVYV